MEVKKLVCDVCGGQIEMLSGGQQGVCSSCGVSYSLNRIKEMYSNIKISVTGTEQDIEQWKKSCELYLQNYEYISAETIVKKILEANPDDEYANQLYKNLQVWKYLEIKNNTLVKYRGNAERVTVPVGVTKIANSAFSNTDVVSVNMPNTVTIIDIGAFEQCRKLVEINIPNSVITIGFRAFRYCESLIKIALPLTIKEIGDEAFEYCKNLATVSPDNLFDIYGNEMFYGSPYGNKKTKIANQKKWKEERRCQHCGGSFKGVFKEKCRSCGKLKDY